MLVDHIDGPQMPKTTTDRPRILHTNPNFFTYSFHTFKLKDNINKKNLISVRSDETR